ncbi:MAG TPA: phage integrase N-terminal SAM-like domain-containing protein [Pyrinomonadaceae bacterium]|nr:phage integrase N-terminal SAM-like domain-containing protein [Pyrinomonadaceae bacterium]
MADDTESAIVLAATQHKAALRNALRLWADSVTAASTERRDELLRYKQTVVEAFFDFADKHPAEISPLDVQAWRARFEEKEISSNTIYARVCFLSSFFRWAMRDVLHGIKLSIGSVSALRHRISQSLHAVIEQAKQYVRSQLSQNRELHINRDY